ncbi:hypothetical protein AGMMS50256_17970 [Betaproteobacteria bacterium]|nr:hypothetical protein AGMMS50256_17970 [Betaproteobacteria bacterium]
MAFDNAVLEKLFPKLKTENPQLWNKRLADFEAAKIESTQEIADGLKSYRNDPAMMEGEALLYVEGI